MIGVIIPMPMPIPMGGGGGIPENTALAMWLSFNLFAIIALAIRYILIRKHKDFNKQSKLKNLFYDLESYHSDLGWSTDINVPFMVLIITNTLFAIGVTTNFFIKIL